MPRLGDILGSVPKPVEPVGHQDPINDMPNSERLTPFERNAYSVLPYVAPVAKGLEWINKTPVGKVLTYLDVLAEGSERALGTGYQLVTHDWENEFDLKNAWNAGTMFYDTLNTPHLYKNENGSWNFEIPSDLPGPEVLAKIRTQLGNGANIDEVKQTYYDDLGALALRAQFQDFWGHLIVDPLNFILPAIKPVERLKGISELAMLNKFDVSEITKLEKVARLAGNVEDADRYLDVLNKVSKGELKGYNTLDKAAIWLSGGDLTKPAKEIDKYLPWKLTPESRASEVTSMVVDHAGSLIGKPHWGDPAGMVGAIKRFANGSTGSEFGHASLTKPGRAVQSQAHAWAAYGDSELKAFDSVVNARTQLAKMASALGERDLRKLLRMAESDSTALATRLANNGIPVQPQQLESMAQLLKTMPITGEEFTTRMMIKLEDLTMQQQIVQQGVKAKGFVTRWANAVKAAETLAFIKLNPSNAIRNMIGNDVAMISRGAFGTMTPGQISKFWTEQGYIPPRFLQSFNLGADEITKDVAGILNKALYPTHGTPEKIKDFFNNIPGLSKISSDIEKSASIRASTVGFMDAARNYIYSKVQNVLPPELMERLDPKLVRFLDNLPKSSFASVKKFREALQKDVAYDVESVLEDASKILGSKIDDNLDPETMSRLVAGLPDAIKNKRVPEFISELKAESTKHLDDLFESNVRNLAEHVENQFVAGGPQQFYRNLGKAIDEIRSAHTDDAIRMGQLTDVLRSAKEAGDFERASSLWSAIKLEREQHFSRMWSKFDAYMEGLEKGAKKIKANFSPQIRPIFKEIKRGWSEFHKFKEKEWEVVFEAIKAKKPAKSVDEVRNAIAQRYEEMIALEDTLTRQADDLLSAGMPPAQAETFKKYRNLVADLSMQDKRIVSQFWSDLGSIPKEEMPNAFKNFFQGILDRRNNLKNIDKMGSAALQGDTKGLQDISNLSRLFPPSELPKVRKIARTYNSKNDFETMGVVNKFLEGKYGGDVAEGAQKIEKINQVSFELARDAFRARLQAGGEIPKGMTMADYIKLLEEPPNPSNYSRQFIPDFHEIVKDPDPLESMINSFTYGKQYAALDSIQDAAQTAKGVNFASLPQDVRNGLNKWVTKIEGEMGNASYYATRMGEFKRDSSLLNYNRRTNFDAFTGNIVPFGFWTTHTALNTVIHSIDRPAMLSSYLRMRQLLDTAGLEDENAPSRLRRNLKINLPFLPDWMGPQFVDPLRLIFPMETWLSPFERQQDSQLKIDGRATRTLDALLQSGEITYEDYQLAKEQKAGPAWDMAVEKVNADDPDMKFDAFDFGTMLMSPHAPLLWAYNLATGNKQDIGPFTPMSRTFRDVATVLGVKDWNNSPYNLEGKIRKQLGLPAFDKWDDYRADRMLANMAAETAKGNGEYTLDQINRAMVEHSGPVWERAVERANTEFTGGPAGAVLRLLGIPVKSYPEGEQDQRGLQDDFGRAMDKYSDAQQALEDMEKGVPGAQARYFESVDALSDFFEEHPEYESRLALYKKPEERMRNFLIDQVWSQYNSFPKLNRDELREQLGSTFSEKFLNKETRSYDSITPEEMQVWIKLMGGDPVGTLTADQNVLTSLFNPDLTPPETAWRVQVFYDTRNQDFPYYYGLQQDYYSQPEGKRKASPALKEYWNWRRQFMYDNPDLVPYLTDNPRDIQEAEQRSRTENAVPLDVPIPNQGTEQPQTPTPQIIWSELSPSAQSLIQDYFNGEELPYVVERQLEFIANRYNMSGEEALQLLEGQQ